MIINRFHREVGSELVVGEEVTDLRAYIVLLVSLSKKFSVGVWMWVFFITLLHV